jgi:hypothetical protein
MINLFQLIFDHRSCIKKLKILIHPDKRPNDRKVAEEEWKQLDTVLSTLTTSFSAWKELTNWEELQYVFQHATEFKSQQTAINDGALCVFVMIEYLNSELELARISQRFQLDFKSQYASLSATQLNDLIHRICIDIRLMSKDNQYHPSIVESQTMIVEEEIVVNDNKYWKQLICQKLGLSINEYSNHFIMNHFGRESYDTNGLMQDCVKYIPGDIMSFVDETEVSSHDSLSTQQTYEEGKLDENMESNTETAQGPQSSDDIVGPQLLETDTAVKKERSRKRKNKKHEKQKTDEDDVCKKQCNEMIQAPRLETMTDKTVLTTKIKKSHKKVPEWFDFKARPISSQAKQYYLQCRKLQRRKLDEFVSLLKRTKNPLSTAPHYFDTTLKLLEEYGWEKCLTHNNVEELLRDRKDLSNFRGGIVLFRRFVKYSK